MNDEGKDGGTGWEPGDDAALWQLLGRARDPEAGPYFSRRVLREVALAEDGGERGRAAGGWRSGLRWLWRRPRAAVWPGVMALGVFWLTVVLTMHAPAPGGVVHHLRPDDSTPADDEPATMADTMAATTPLAEGEAATPSESEDVAPQDVEVIADLDNMINREENRLWTEDTAVF